MTTPHRVPDLLLEKLHLGELSPDEANAVRARLSAEPNGYERLAALASDEATSPARLHPRRAPKPPAVPARWRFAIPALVAAIATLFLVTRPTSDSASSLRAKGDALATAKPALLVYRQRSGAPPELLQDGAHAEPGDRLQLAYIAAGREVGAILSVDGAGHVTTHLPVTRFDLTRPFDEIRLPTAFALDDAPGFERFVLMTLAPDTHLPELVTVTVKKP